MIILLPTTDSLQLVTGSAGAVDTHISWVDNNPSSPPPVPGKSANLVTTATSTTITAAPAASTYRNITDINIRNAHVSNSNLITVNVVGAVTVELFKCTLGPGEVLTKAEGLGWNIFAADGSHKASGSPVLFRNLAADATGQAANTAQPWFPSLGGITLPANTTYFMEGLLQLTTGATTHTTGLLFAGTATLTSIMYETVSSQAAAGVMVAPTHNIASVATNVATNATGTGVEQRISLSGTVRINGAGTLIPQFIFSANPTGTILVKRNTFFRMWPIGSGSVETVGTWS